MSHFMIKCSCGVVLDQCRCMGEKPITVKKRACPKCIEERLKEDEEREKSGEVQ